jgi:sugar-specific transcriptional regulator TrmB
MSEPTTKELADKIARMEETIDDLSRKLDKEIRHSANMFRLNTEIRTLIENDVIDAFERAKHIELTIFPNLGSDIVNLNRIVGEGDGKAWNPLDKRDQ